MLDIVLSHRALIQYGVIALLALACWLWGGGPERVCATVLLAMPFAEVIYHLILGPETSLTHTDLGHTVMELVVTAPFLAVALTANRRYPLWLVSFQLVAVLSHLVRDLAPGAGGAAYLIMTIAPSYAMIVTLAAGLAAHRLRIRRHGSYRSWRASSAPLPATMPDR